MAAATNRIFVAGELYNTACSFSRPTFPPPTISTCISSSFKKTGNKALPCVLCGCTCVTSFSVFTVGVILFVQTFSNPHAMRSVAHCCARDVHHPICGAKNRQSFHRLHAPC